MSLNIPEGYEVHYAIRQPDGNLLKDCRGVMVWWDQSNAEHYLAQMRENMRGVGIEYLATIESRICSPFTDRSAPVQGVVDEIERWRKSTGGQA